MKKSLLWIVVLVLSISMVAAFSLYGCKAEEKVAAEDTKVETTEAQPEENYKIGFITWTIGHSVPAAWNTGIGNELKDFTNVQYQVFDGEMKTETQVAQMQGLINQKYDAIIIQAADAAALSSAVQDAEAAGIPVIVLNLDVTVKHAGLVTMVHYEAGQIIAKEIAKQLDEKGNVVIIQGPPGASAAIDRERGFREEMENYPGIEIIAAQPADWLKEKAISVMNSFLQAYPEINAVFGVNDSMAEGAALAAESAGRLNEMVIWGDDGEKDALTMIEQGKLTGTIYTNCFEQGATAARLAMYLITSGIKPESIPNTGVIKMAPIVVTKDNVDTISPDIRW